MRILFFQILFCLIAQCITLHGQDIPSYKSFSQKDQKRFNSAKLSHKQKKVDQALKQYCKLLNKYSGHPEIELWIGLAYKDKGENSLALPHLIIASQNGNSKNVLLFSTIAELYKKEKHYESAKEYYSYFLERIDSNSVRYAKGKKLYDQMEFAAYQVKNPVSFNPVPLGYNINTLHSEYLPQFTADHSTLYFTRRIRGQEDIYYAEKKGGEYSKSISFDIVNSSEHNEGAHTISADGQIFIFTHCDDKTGIGGCDLYITKKTNEEWGNPKNMGARINSILWESQPSLSGDGNILFFSSTRDGGHGGRDIWYTLLGKDGIWSNPINAGNIINTSQDESSPFLHADLKTLYFRSKGHLGMGNFDLFFTKRDKNGQWGEIKNLGYPINTEGQEGALTISLDGTKGYFATNFDGESLRNNLDIYEFDLPFKIRPQPCTYVKIRSINIDTKMPVTSELQLIDITTNTIISTKKTNINGEALIPVPLRKALMINVQSQGYIFFSDNLIIDSIAHGMSPYSEIVELSPIQKATVLGKTKTTFVLKNIFFEFSTADLKEVSFLELERLSRILIDKTSLNLIITGHTDNIGTEKDNLKLSKQRAESVKLALVGLGVNTSRIVAEGKGESQPLADNSTKEGRQHNRRTEFSLY